MSNQYTKAYCKYTLPALRNTIPLGLNSIKVQNFHRKCRHYMYAYLEGHTAGRALEEQDCCKVASAHWSKRMKFHDTILNYSD